MDRRYWKVQWFPAAPLKGVWNTINFLLAHESLKYSKVKPSLKKNLATLNSSEQ